MTPEEHPTLKTPRLVMRPVREDDSADLAALNADPRVMEYFPAPLTRAESDVRARRMRDHFDAHGFGVWVVEAPGVAGFIGQVGLVVISFETHFTPCVEVAWRLLPEYWGRGYATEAASAALDFGFDTLGLNEIVAFTVPANQRSRRVMERLGMTRSPADDFDHPKVPEGHPLRRCMLYRIAADAWRARHR